MFGKKNAYPVKKTLNLVIKDRPPYYYRKLSLGVLAGIVVIGAFAKFAVIDRINAARAVESEAEAERVRYEQLFNENAIFHEVRAEYEKYFTRVEENNSLADSADALRIIEQTLMQSASVKSAVFSENVLSVVLTDIDLEQISVIVKELYENEVVSSASVSSADTTVEDTYSSVSMSITLVAEGGGAQ